MFSWTKSRRPRREKACGRKGFRREAMAAFPASSYFGAPNLGSGRAGRVASGRARSLCVHFSIDDRWLEKRPRQHLVGANSRHTLVLPWPLLQPSIIDAKMNAEAPCPTRRDPTRPTRPEVRCSKIRTCRKCGHRFSSESFASTRLLTTGPSTLRPRKHRIDSS
jgi:hypothetical protein